MKFTFWLWRLFGLCFEQTQVFVMMSEFFLCFSDTVQNIPAIFCRMLMILITDNNLHIFCFFLDSKQTNHFKIDKFCLFMEY